ncbi:hypothetical protein IE53DRAFT_124670 [Violaceomyces palustris]|uniref:Uncharacterized protein n=1 Tax=Violaceomyces palustris TaxID=1673888 RepID=A0ACD0NVH6_9BASI|nr:hypothetical protein IE53DRAFT_124670 [Violaceomyces palustris]
MIMRNVASGRMAMHDHRCNEATMVRAWRGTATAKAKENRVRESRVDDGKGLAVGEERRGIFYDLILMLILIFFYLREACHPQRSKEGRDVSCGKGGEGPSRSSRNTGDPPLSKRMEDMEGMDHPSQPPSILQRDEHYIKEPPPTPVPDLLPPLRLRLGWCKRLWFVLIQALDPITLDHTLSCHLGVGFFSSHSPFLELLFSRLLCESDALSGLLSL